MTKNLSTSESVTNSVNQINSVFLQFFFFGLLCSCLSLIPSRMAQAAPKKKELPASVSVSQQKSVVRTVQAQQTERPSPVVAEPLNNQEFAIRDDTIPINVPNVNLEANNNLIMRHINNNFFYPIWDGNNFYLVRPFSITRANGTQRLLNVSPASAWLANPNTVTIQVLPNGEMIPSSPNIPPIPILNSLEGNEVLNIHQFTLDRNIFYNALINRNDLDVINIFRILPFSQMQYYLNRMQREHPTCYEIYKNLLQNNENKSRDILLNTNQSSPISSRQVSFVQKIKRIFSESGNWIATNRVATIAWTVSIVQSLRTLYLQNELNQAHETLRIVEEHNSRVEQALQQNQRIPPPIPVSTQQSRPGTNS